MQNLGAEKDVEEGVKEGVDKIRLPAVVRMSRSFWDDARKGTEKGQRQFVLRQLTQAAQCRKPHSNCAVLKFQGIVCYFKVFSSYTGGMGLQRPLLAQAQQAK